MKTENNQAILLKKIKSKNITIGVIGIGYVGLPLALEYSKKGIRTIGFDVDKTKINQLNKGKNYNQDLDSKDVKKCVSEKLLSATDDFSRLKECDVIFICVPTPFTPNK